MGRIALLKPVHQTLYLGSFSLPGTCILMIDPFGRKISYLRVSVTDRCDFRCVYCMAEHMTFLPKAEVLSLEELDRLCSAFIGLGVKKLRLTGGEPLVRKNVMDGVRAAKEAGLRVKINTVALKGVNDDEVDTLVEWCGREGHDLTFIEVMPMGDIGGENRLDQYLPISLLRAQMARRWTLEESSERTGGPARYVRIKETGQRVGFITPLTHNFCESCNRVRVTCTGMLYMCLGQEDSADLRAPLRASESDALLIAAIEEAITRKPKGHDFMIDRRHQGPAVGRHMSVTGG